jgi:hypothetical protein
MKTSFLVILTVTAAVILMIPQGSFGQLRNQQPVEKPDVYESIVKPADVSNLILGFFNPDNFQMHHSYSMSYSSMGGKGIALGMYTNSMLYRISNPLTLRVDWSLAYSPFSSFSKQFQNDLSGLFLNRAELDYRPSKDLRINLQFRQIPGGYYSPSYYDYYNPMYRGFYNEEDWFIGSR